MSTTRDTLIALENKFWQALVDEDADTATSMLTEPAYMVSAHGAMKFDHAGYRKMAEQGPMVLQSYQITNMEVAFPNDATAILSYHVKQQVSERGKDTGRTEEVNDTSTWIREGESWKCVMHTETPAKSAATHSFDRRSV